MRPGSPIYDSNALGLLPTLFVVRHGDRDTVLDQVVDLAVGRGEAHRRFGQTEFQILVNLIDFDMPVQQAIEAPRFALEAKPNFYKPGADITVTIESRTAPATLAALKAMGHKLEILPGWGSIGHMQTIRVDPKTGAMTAGGDPTRTGYAMG